MRLRYLHVGKYPPINDVEILFASGSPLQRECAIRFVVGVNGSGKSNLLRAIAEVFIALADGRLPMFPVQVIYELGERDSANHRTLILDCMEKRASASLWLGENYICPDSATTEQFADVFECLRNNSPTIPPQFRPLIAKGGWPTGAVTPTPIALPTTVLAYTTGDTNPWQSIWSRNQSSGEGNSTKNNDNDNGEERPAGWTLDKEMLIHSDETVESNDTQLEASSSEAPPDDLARPVLLTKKLLKCALLAVALSDAVREEFDAADPSLSEQRALLKESLARGGWQELVSVAFRCRLQPTLWKDRLRKVAHDWCLSAGEVIAELYPEQYARNIRHRTLHFDLRGQFKGQKAFDLDLRDCASQGEALLQLLGGRKDPPFKLFKRLNTLHQAGLFHEIELRLRRQSKPNISVDTFAQERDDGVMRYEELSDGEQMVLGRFALLHLLEGQHDSLLLLDEPETHFNDLWKRDIISVVDGVLAKTSCEVVIATHASLVLTDVLKHELVVLDRIQPDDPKQRSGTVVRILDSDAHTFGATGDHPLRDIFGATDTVGRRASRLLDVLIAAASIAEKMNTYWAGEQRVRGDLVIDNLLRIVQVTESDLTREMVLDNLNSIESFARYFGAPTPLQMEAVLEAFIEQTGPGYFQIALKRAWYRLTREGAHAV
jgi:predicted ATPase